MAILRQTSRRKLAQHVVGRQDLEVERTFSNQNSSHNSQYSTSETCTKSGHDWE